MIELQHAINLNRRQAAVHDGIIETKRAQIIAAKEQLEQLGKELDVAIAKSNSYRKAAKILEMTTVYDTGGVDLPVKAPAKKAVTK